jgi:hypothetical protein
LIIAKESRLEGALWACFLALEELSALLRDVAALGLAVPASRKSLEQRVARAGAHSNGIREIIEQNEPIPLGSIPGRREHY